MSGGARPVETLAAPPTQPSAASPAARDANLERDVMERWRGGKRREGNVLYLEALPLIAGLAHHFPDAGGWMRIDRLADRAAGFFPPELSAVARERLTRRSLELGSLLIQRIPVPLFVGIDLGTDELVCPRHPDALEIGDSFVFSPKTQNTTG